MPNNLAGQPTDPRGKAARKWLQLSDQIDFCNAFGYPVDDLVIERDKMGAIVDADPE